MGIKQTGRKIGWILCITMCLAGLLFVGLSSGGLGVPAAVRVPILLYHHITEEVTGKDVELSPETFELHMEALAKAGYTAVTFDQLVGYVERGERLPERPVCITMDDGYLSNYELAWPILERCGMKATVFLIGSCVGHAYYKDTEFPVTPYFSWEQGREMLHSDVIDLQCHTYDLHQWEPFEPERPVRKNILPLPGETEEAYTRVVTEDLRQFQRIYEAELGRRAYVLAYPEGKYNELAERIVRAEGFSVTVSTDIHRENLLKRGERESLYELGRINVEADMTAEELLEQIE